MNETVAFPDIEAALVGWLPVALASHGVTQTVSTRVPNPRPDRFVRIVRVGGSQSNVVTDRPRVTVECWDDNAPDAAATARIARAVLAALKNVTTASGHLIYGTSEEVGPFLLPDVSQQPRYTFTVQLHVRGVPL